MKNPLLVITGPTGSGKTSLALQILSQIQGAIVSADSRQVYSGVDYVTNKVSPLEDLGLIIKNNSTWIMNGVSIYGYDRVNPKEEYHVAQFITDTKNDISSIWSEGKLPILVGGTGYYIDAVLGFSSYSEVPPQPLLRKRLTKLTTDTLCQIIQEKDPTFYKKIHESEKHNQIRLIRYVEIIETVGSMHSSQTHERFIEENAHVFEVALWDVYPLLYERSDHWIKTLIDKNYLTFETEWLMETYPDSKLMKGMLFNVEKEFVGGNITADERLSLLHGQLHSYIRRQIHWLRRRKNRYDCNLSPQSVLALVDTIRKWYDGFAWQH